jgi:hypothetical protein
MPTESAPGDLLPVHLRPKDDELLSSWLVRLAIAHSLSPDTFYALVMPHKPKFPNYVDERDNEGILSILPYLTGVTSDKIKATTLTRYRKVLLEYPTAGRLVPRDMSTQWLLPTSHRSSSSLLFGLQYCPQCLSEDGEPYFRRRWRFAFVTICGTHKTLLLDRCTNCGLPIDFRRNAAEDEGKKKKRSSLMMTRCYSCKFDVRAALPQRAPRTTFWYDSECQEYLLEALDKKSVIDRKGVIHSTYAFFYALYKLTTLLAHGEFGKFIRTQLCRRYGVKMFTVTQPENYKCIELLNVRERFGLIRLAIRVIAEWPDDMAYVNWQDNARPYQLFAKRDQESVGD